MASPRRPWFHGLALVAGSLLVALAGLHHPILSGDGAAQLALVAGTDAWPLTHWEIAFGYVLVVVGSTGLLNAHVGSAGAGAARTGMIASAFGYTVSLMGVLFMLGAVTALARAYRLGEPGLASTHAVFAFDMLHPFARAALRIGAFAISLGLYAWGWAVRSGGVFPRWLGWAGVGAGALGAAVAVACSADSTYVVAGVGLATLWQLVAGAILLKGPAVEP
jgi:hypothetical protein